ncbi:MAG: glycosyltransferase [Pseudomonadota bacterium]|jgi:UDP-N-acetylglucosamine transferase subunit ALG13|nr:glycosyltransferase [Pseudomonadota bacterium]
MIFATVGTQLPFPRFLEAVDRVAGRRGLKVIAQTCDPGCSYAHMETHATLAPSQFDRLVRSADIIVGHAGIGTILSAARAEKPAVLFARRADLGEHRNDHQMATLSSFRDRPGIYAATTEDELDHYMTASNLKPFTTHDVTARQPLIDGLRAFINR